MKSRCVFFGAYFLSYSQTAYMNQYSLLDALQLIGRPYSLCAYAQHETQSSTFILITVAFALAFHSNQYT